MSITHVFRGHLALALEKAGQIKTPRHAAPRRKFSG
jgi:hypothetical protein